MIAKVINAIIIQSLGTVASFATVWFITNKYGLSYQGNFAIIKSWVDLMVVFGSLGFAQSFSYAINRLNVDRVKLKTFSILYSLLLVPIIWIITSLFYPNIDNGYISIAASLLIMHSLLRGVYLTINDNIKFSIVSIIPAVGLFIITITISIFCNNLSISSSYIISALVSVIIVLVFIHSKRFDFKFTSIPWGIILKNGNSVFLQGLSISMLPATTFYILKISGATSEDIGVLSIANYFYMAFALPFNMVAPILFNKWAKSNNKKETKREVYNVLLVCILIFIFSIVAIILLPDIISIFFPYSLNKEKIVGCASIMLFAASPLFLSRVITAYLQALGKFGFVSLVYSIKTAFCLLIAIVFYLGEIVSVNYIAVTWVLGEVLLLIMLYIKSHKTGKDVQ